MLLNQQHQADISGLTPMPIDRIDDTSVVNTATSETVVWYYSNSGTRAAAAGQAAGTMCEAKLTYTGVLNSSGSAIGCKDDTSLSFAAATRASTLVRVPEEAFSKMLDMTYAEKVVYIATWLDTNGDYAIDHRRGQVWCLMKATAANDSATYSYCTTLTGGGTGDKVDIIKVGGDTVAAANTARTTATKVIPVQVIDENGNVVGGSTGPTAPQAYGIDATGADTYATIVTAGATRTHMSVSLAGSNSAIVSIDSGTTDHFYIPANSAWVFDDILIANAATVQGKNGSAGNNYTNLAITIW